MHLQIPYKIQTRKKLSKKMERQTHRMHLAHQRVHVAQRLPTMVHAERAAIGGQQRGLAVARERMRIFAQEDTGR